MVRRSRTSRNEYPGLDPQALRALRYRAAQLAGRGAFADLEREDLEQEFAVDLLARIPKYDPDRGALSTFVRCVVENRVAVMLRRRTAAKRVPGRSVASLQDEVDDGAGRRVGRCQTLGTEALHRRTGAANPDAQEAVDLRLDVRTAVEALPTAQRDICAWLCHYSVSEAARAARMPRSTVHDHLAGIRDQFRAAGLDVHAKRRPATSRERA